MALKSNLVLKEIFSGSLSTGELPPGYNSLFSPLVYAANKSVGLNGYEFFINNTIDYSRSNRPFYFNDGNDWRIVFDTGYYGNTNKWIIVNEHEYSTPKIAYISSGQFLDAPENVIWSGLKEGNNIGYSSNRLELYNQKLSRIYPPTGGEAYVHVKSDQSWIVPLNEFQNFAWRSGDVAYFEGSSEINSSGIRVTGLPSTKWIEVNSGLSLNHTVVGYPVRSGNSTFLTGLPWEYNPYTGFWLDMPDNVTLYPAKDSLNYWFNKSGLTIHQAFRKDINPPGGITGWWAQEYNGNVSFIYTTKIARKGLNGPANFNGPELNILNGTGSPVGDYLYLQINGPSYYNYYYALNNCTRTNERHELPPASLSDASKFPTGKHLSYASLGQYIPGPKGWANNLKIPPITKESLTTFVNQQNGNRWTTTFTGQFWLGPYATGGNYIPVINSEGIQSAIITGGKTGALTIQGDRCLLNGYGLYGTVYPTPPQNITYMEWLGFSYESGYLFSLPNIPTGLDLYNDKFTLPPSKKSNQARSAYNSNIYRPGKALYSDWFPDFKIEKIENQNVVVFNPVTGALQQDISYNITYSELLPNYSLSDIPIFEQGANINVGYNPSANKYTFETTSGNYSNDIIYLDRGKEYRFLQTGYATNSKKILFFTDTAEYYTPNYSLDKFGDYHLSVLNFNQDTPSNLYYSSADGLTTGIVKLVGRPIKNLFQSLYDPVENLDSDTYIFDLVFGTIDTLTWPDGSCCKNGPRYRTYNWDGSKTVYPDLSFRKGSWVSIIRVDANESFILNERMYFFTGNNFNEEYKFGEISGYLNATHLDFPDVSFVGQIPDDPYKGQYWQLLQFYVPHNLSENLDIKYGSQGTGYMPKGHWNSRIRIVDNERNYNVPAGNYLGNNQPVFSGNLILTSTDVNFSGRIPVILSGQGLIDYIRPFTRTTSAKTVDILNKNATQVRSVIQNAQE